MSRTFQMTIGRAVGHFLALAAICGGVLAAIFWEVRVRGSSCGEVSVVEFAQVALLAAVSAGLFAAAAKLRRFRGGLLLMGGFFLCLVIRENDRWLDAVYKGFWFPVALLAALVAVVLAWRERAGIRPCLAAVCRLDTLPYLLSGLVCLMLFSRLFGSKMLWQPVYGAEAARTIKNVSEESLELLADALLAFWALLTIPRLAAAEREECHG